MWVTTENRSSWPSTSGKVPVVSYGFCVATRKNGWGSVAGDAVDGDLALLHRLEQRRLGAGGRPVQLVDEHDVREERAGPELPLVAGEVEHGDAGELGRQEVRGALDPVEDAADGAGERLGEEGLADAGDVLDEQVPAREQRDEGEGDRLGLAPQHALDPGADVGRQPGARPRCRDRSRGTRRSGSACLVFGVGWARPKQNQPQVRRQGLPEGRSIAAVDPLRLRRLRSRAAPVR